jgi:hypothetical protein
MSTPASVRLVTHERLAKDDKQPSVSAQDGRLLAAKNERVRLPNTSPNLRARALRWRGCDRQGHDAMTTTCPECGGGSLRELTPGFYECMSPIDVSLPPDPAGNPGWLHGSRPCGHRFQAGPALATEPCWCRRHSIERCRDCKRPLCGLHGTAGGELLCGNCVTASAARQQTEEAGQPSPALARSRREDATSARTSRTARPPLSSSRFYLTETQPSQTPMRCDRRGPVSRQATDSMRRMKLSS